MIRHVWTIPCRVCLRDRETNNISLIEVVEELSIEASAASVEGLVPTDFQVVTLWEREDENQASAGFGQLSLIAPDAHVLLIHEYAIDLSQHRRTRHQGMLFGFPAHGPGRYEFRVDRRLTPDAKWEQVGSVAIWLHAGLPPVATADQ